MPGPMSDSYDPEFSTDTNAQEIRDAIREVVQIIGIGIGFELKDIFDVIYSKNGSTIPIGLSERQLRIIRYGLNYALDCI